MSHSPLVFFGTSEFSAIILDELKKANILPSLVVTAPDKPKGRGLILTPPPVKIWAEKENISVLQPEKLSDPAFLNALRSTHYDLFVVASYGKIIPKIILNIPRRGTLNVHPSLLPLLRGPSPIQSALLSDQKDTGVTIMLLDEEMDHGPIVAKEKVSLETWPLPYPELEKILGERGGALLAKTVSLWLEESITAIPQEHEKATYTKKIEKSDGEIDPEGDPYQNWLTFNAYYGWPGTYFIATRKNRPVRVIITRADYRDGVFSIQRVKPEGKNEMSYDDFLRGA
jgi:methionyl-tRNA formyltransferase